MVGWCSMGTFNDPCFPSRFPAGWTFPPHNGRPSGAPGRRPVWTARRSRISCCGCPARRCCRRTRTMTRTSRHGFHRGFLVSSWGFLWWVHGISKDFSVKNFELWGFKYERGWVNGDLTWFNHEQWGFIRIWPWHIVISWDFMGFRRLSWWIQLQ